MCFNQIGFYDIISNMIKRLLHIFPVVACLTSGAAYANWQYPGTYVGDGWYADDGSRFVISVRGGASYSFASIKNEIGSMTAEYFYNPADGMLYLVRGMMRALILVNATDLNTQVLVIWQRCPPRKIIHHFHLPQVHQLVGRFQIAPSGG